MPAVDDVMIGWVVLSTSWTELTVDSLRARPDRVFPGEFLPPRERGTFVIDGPIPRAQFFINSAIANASGTFLLDSVPGPYAEVSGFAAHIGDRELRDLALAQQAWLALELIGTETPGAETFIGKVLADLAPEDAAVLAHPSRLTAQRFDAETRSRLAAGLLA